MQRIIKIPYSKSRGFFIFKKICNVLYFIRIIAVHKNRNMLFIINGIEIKVTDIRRIGEIEKDSAGIPYFCIYMNGSANHIFSIKDMVAWDMCAERGVEIEEFHIGVMQEGLDRERSHIKREWDDIRFATKVFTIR